MTKSSHIRLATRGSALALWQANRVRDLIGAKFASVTTELVTVNTVADRNPGRSLEALGGDKGLFVKELELALLEGHADAAVHSLKDVPIDDTPEKLELVAFPERADARDVFISRCGAGLGEMAPGSVVATSAPRRKAQVLALRPDLKVCDVRGNVDTRLRKLDEGQFDGIVLAAAGLERLGMQGRVTQWLAIEEFMPAPGQGILAIEAALDSPLLVDLWHGIDDTETRLKATAEREFCRGIGADCHTAAGCYLEVNGSNARFSAAVLSEDGSQVRRFSEAGSITSVFDLVAAAVACLKGESGQVTSDLR